MYWWDGTGCAVQIPVFVIEDFVDTGGFRHDIRHEIAIPGRTSFACKDRERARRWRADYARTDNTAGLQRSASASASTRWVSPERSSWRKRGPSCTRVPLVDAVSMAHTSSSTLSSTRCTRDRLPSST